MKKIRFSVLSLLLTASVLFFSCGSTETDGQTEEPVAPKAEIISTVSTNHVSVEQTDSIINIVLTKKADEQISSVKISDEQDKTSVLVPVTDEKINFTWPFAEKDKECTLRTDLLDENGKTLDTEYISFKVEGNPACVKYSEAFDNSVLVLIARGNERTVKFYSTQDILKNVTEDLKTSASNLKISIYSGKKSKADENTVPVAVLTKSISSKEDLQEVFDGYDLIKNAGLFNMTATEMNEALSKNKTYYAAATISFEMENLKGLTFNTKQLWTNETIYTPVSKTILNEIDNIKTDSDSESESKEDTSGFYGEK